MDLKNLVNFFRRKVNTPNKVILWGFQCGQSLALNEKNYLNTVGITPNVSDAYIAALNARRNINAPTASRLYVERNARNSGNILRPVLMLHTLYDPLARVSHERDYLFTVALAARQNLLFQVYTNDNGPFNFTCEQRISLTSSPNR